MIIIYDGECPFCKRYVKLLRLQSTLGTVKMVNARDSVHPAVEEAIARGADLDEGMVVIDKGDLYHGDQAILHLTILSTPVGVFSRIMRWLIRGPRSAGLLYPLLKLGRNTVLKLIGKHKMGY